MIQLITIIKQSESAKKSERLIELPNNFKNFFLPARKIIPRQYQEKIRRNPRVHELTSACYTHTTSYLGKCYIICNNQVVSRCGI